MKAEIETLTIKLGDKTLTFTMAEAKALMDVLNEKLGQRVAWPTVIEKHVHHPVHVPRIRDPFHDTWRRPTPTPWDDTKITCETRANDGWNAGERLDSMMAEKGC